MSFSVFFLELVVNFFDYFRKPNSMLSTFCVNCLLMYYFVYCNICAFKKLMEPVNAPARWWPCACLNCVSGLRRLKKTSNFLRCLHVFDRVLKCGLDINEGKSIQLLFYFIVLVGIVASLVGLSFFQLCFMF